MEPERWKQIDQLLDAALDRPTSERGAFLDQACAGDAALRRELEALLNSDGQAGTFIESPAFELVAESLAEDQSPSLVGQHIGRYRLLSFLGSGGMGEVYLAQDSRLDRQVALKLLPESFTRDDGRVRRFEQEARAASRLSHPNICVIHEVSETDHGHHFITMEYIDGVTLRQHIAGPQISLGETLDVAIQVASGLSAAHQAGIVHRDIKPENIMLRTDGYVKVLDFGLAKLTERQHVNEGTASPSIREVKTDADVVMGTARYMSPEQARRLDVDGRTDIWSLGVILYEIVAGHAPFEGDTNSDVIVSILEREPPPITQHASEVAAGLQRIITRALQKDREKRYQAVKEMLDDLKSLKQDLDSEALSSDSRQSRSRGPRATIRWRSSRAKTLMASLAGAALVIGGSAWLYASRHTSGPPLPPMRVVPFTTFPGDEYLGTFSPDGNQIAFGWNGDKGGASQGSSIYVKQIGVEKPLRVTFDSRNDFGPVWSPDGQRIAFIRSAQTETAIYIVSTLGGAERKLLDLGPPQIGGPAIPTLAWSPDGRFIAFTCKNPNEPYRLSLVSPETLARLTLTSPSAENVGDFNPAFSPDSRSVAFARLRTRESSDIYTVPTAGGEPRRLTFDNITVDGLAWTADGREIIFSSRRSGGNSSLWRIPASGGAAERVALSGLNFFFPNIARRGNRLTYVQTVEDSNIYRIDLSDSKVSGTPVKLISSTWVDDLPQFSSDGKRIAFQSERSGRLEIWISDSDGRNQTQVTALNRITGSPRWSPDGREIAFCSIEDGRGDIYAISAEGGLPRPVVTSNSDDVLPSWSSDGKWIFFSSNRTGEYQVWKTPAQGGEAVQVTRQGGGSAFASPDGQHVYYVKEAPVPGIWSVPVNGGEEVRVLNSFKSENYGGWAVVNDGIYFMNSDGSDSKQGVAIQFLNFATGKVKRIASLGKANISPNCLAVSPDRRQILYTRIDGGGADIMLVENFR